MFLSDFQPKTTPNLPPAMKIMKKILNFCLSHPEIHFMPRLTSHMLQLFAHEHRICVSVVCKLVEKCCLTAACSSRTRRVFAQGIKTTFCVPGIWLSLIKNSFESRLGSILLT